MQQLCVTATLAHGLSARWETNPKWPSPCNRLFVQVARLQREMEGLEEQRTRAREEARRAEHARQQLEMEIKVCVPQC